METSASGPTTGPDTIACPFLASHWRAPYRRRFPGCPFRERARFMNTIEIDQAKCIGCGACVGVCPMFLLKLQNEKSTPIPKAEQWCIACGHCVSACPVEAVTAAEVRPDKCEPIDPITEDDFQRMANVVKSRRSIRHYQNRPIETQKIKMLLDLVRWAPTARHLLPVRWMVINEPGVVGELSGMVIELLTRGGSLGHLMKAWESGIDMIHRGAPCLIATYTDDSAMLPAVDCTIATEILDMLAPTLKLGTCWAGFFLHAAQSDRAIADRLGLAENETFQTAMMVGYPEETYQRAPWRPEVPVRWIHQ